VKRIIKIRNIIDPITGRICCGATYTTKKGITRTCKQAPANPGNGSGRCKFHGGARLSSNIKELESVYSDIIKDPKLRHLIDQARKDPNLGNLTDEMMVVKAILAQSLAGEDELDVTAEKLAQGRTALVNLSTKLLFYASDNERPEKERKDFDSMWKTITSLVELGIAAHAKRQRREEFMSILDKYTKLVATQNNIDSRSKEVISKEEFLQFIRQISVIIEEAVPDEETRTKISAALVQKLNLGRLATVSVQPSEIASRTALRTKNSGQAEELSPTDSE
jgi:hypothetical protein